MWLIILPSMQQWYLAGTQVYHYNITGSTVVPVYNDHLYNRMYYLRCIQ